MDVPHANAVIVERRVRARDREVLNDCAAAAMRSIQENGLHIDPRSFSVWYEYHQGSNPDLRRLIDILLSNRKTVGTDDVARLYDRFIANPGDHQDLRATAERMQDTLCQVLALVREAGVDASRFGTAIRTVSGRFADSECSIGTLVQCLISEARDVAARAGRIEGALTRNGEMIRTMQHSLSDAREAAITDALTGLANRRHLDETMRVLTGVAMNDGGPVSLLIFDIDHFKRVNDRWGHPVGDLVIQLAAATIRADLRDTDLAARYGGEEFAVLLPGVAIDEATTIGERIRKAFATHKMVLRESREAVGMLTVSVGAAGYEPGEPLAEWVRRADAALYEAKAAGRNRLVVAHVPEDVA